MLEQLTFCSVFNVTVATDGVRFFNDWKYYSQFYFDFMVVMVQC